ncbi:hypothetical protein HYFRA_00011740 [Hymenoscyphus fraxineus]|uniref:Uncharacterized protein n=1 Tax=Hymenoscyphus fraxineus TaxID=746836 RepID=A0A9N9PLS9_9HELO|nr:hypothetical protein HYFRA_00011740 [Hymenoscyphus fraxineus]
MQPFPHTINPPPPPKKNMSARETISLAHTARCKLMLAADKPDRNLRFILGHAFTLDKLRLRVLEIEDEALFSDSDSDSDDPPIYDEFAASNPGRNDPTPQRVSFPTNARPARPNNARNRSPPPPPGADAHHDDEDDEYADEDDEEKGGNGLSLRRFESASARPPQMIDDREGDSDEDDEPVSPPQIPSDLDLQSLTTGPENEELAGLYGHVKGCPCHGQHQDAPDITKAWEVPMKLGQKGKRIAVVQVEA